MLGVRDHCFVNEKIIVSVGQWQMGRDVRPSKSVQ
jgi:hypothetical protein